MASSEGLRRRSWLLDERWPGVCERGIGGARSWACARWWVGISLVSNSGVEGRWGVGARASVGELTLDIFWERMIFVLCGDCSVSSLSRPIIPAEAALAWSAIVGWSYHFLHIQPAEYSFYSALRQFDDSYDWNPRVLEAV